MNELIALDLPGGPGFVDALRRIWDDGDAAAPIDQRLPAPARARLLNRLAPAAVVDASGRSELTGGRPILPGDALVMTTSGTTGDPKGVVLTHDGVAASAEASASYIGTETGDHWLACLPLAHVGGLSVITRALHHSAELTVLPSFDVDAVTRAAASGANLVSLVPAVLDRIDAGPFRRVLLGGSAIPADRPPNAVATYGMTETGSGVVYDGHRLAGVELRIVAGQVEVRGPMLLRGYRDGTDPKDPDGWFPTGDAGALDAEGVLSVFGRVGDVIVTGGENVWPVAVERVLETHSGVAAVAVVGRPDPTWGHRVTAVIVAAGAPPSLDELRDHVRTELPAYAAPHEVEFVTELPRTGLGKVRRSAL